MKSTFSVTANLGEERVVNASASKPWRGARWKAPHERQRSPHRWGGVSTVIPVTSDHVWNFHQHRRSQELLPNVISRRSDAGKSRLGQRCCCWRAAGAAALGSPHAPLCCPRTTQTPRSVGSLNPEVLILWGLKASTLFAKRVLLKTSWQWT